MLYTTASHTPIHTHTDAKPKWKPELHLQAHVVRGTDFHTAPKDLFVNFCSTFMLSPSAFFFCTGALFVVLLFRDRYQVEHCSVLFWIGSTTCALSSCFSSKSLSRVKRHHLPQRGSVSHLCVAAGSQSLAAPLAAQAGPVPVLPERRHLLS